MTHSQALRKYAANQDAEAFRVLVEQYQRLVYSAASRRLCRVEDVEDVVQLTFLKLAKSAGSIRHNLSMWLYTTAVNAANDLIRRDTTRGRNEALVANTEAASYDTEQDDWKNLSVMIDDAVLELPEDQRLLIVEHYFGGRSQRDLAELLNISQPTVLRRLKVAVEALRESLARRGYTAATPTLVLGLETLPQSQVPATVTAELIKVGLTGISSHSVVTSLSLGIWAKIATCCFGLMALIVVIKVMHSATAPPVAIAKRDWQVAFEKAYALQPGENLKFIPLPPLPERQRYLREIEQDTIVPSIQWRWRNGQIEVQLFQTSPTLASILKPCAGLDHSHVSVTDLPTFDVNGDWIVRDGATTESILEDMRKILLDRFKANVVFEKTDVTKEAIVVSGEFLLRLLPETTGGLQVYSDVLDRPKADESTAGGGRGTPAEVWSQLGESLGVSFVDETHGEPPDFGWRFSWSGLLSGKTETGRKQILENITQQTGVTFRKEERHFVVWKATVSPLAQSTTRTAP